MAAFFDKSRVCSNTVEKLVPFPYLNRNISFYVTWVIGNSVHSNISNIGPYWGYVFQDKHLIKNCIQIFVPFCCMIGVKIRMGVFWWKSFQLKTFFVLLMLKIISLHLECAVSWLDVWKDIIFHMILIVALITLTSQPS